METIEKSLSHKYLRKEPDGKGGWNYIYEEPKEKISVAEQMLQITEHKVDDLIELWKKSYEKQFDREMSEYDIEMTRLTVTHEMLRSIEIYTKPTDRIVGTVRAYTSPKGTLEINTTIEREGVTYPFSTNVIYAGGHNIQRLHYRYLTATKLPQTGNSTESDKIKEKIKRLTKVEKLNNEIKGYEQRIKDNEQIIKDNEKLTDQQIVDTPKESDSYGRLRYLTWEGVIERGNQGNFDNDKSKFEKYKSDIRQEQIDRWRDNNIGWVKRNTESLKEEIVKLNKKLKQIINVI